MRQDSPEFFQGCARLVSLLQGALIDRRNLATTARLGGAHDDSARSNLRPVVFRKRSPSSNDNAAPDGSSISSVPSDRQKVPVTRRNIGRQRVEQRIVARGKSGRARVRLVRGRTSSKVRHHLRPCTADILRSIFDILLELSMMGI